MFCLFVFIKEYFPKALKLMQAKLYSTNFRCNNLLALPKLSRSGYCKELFLENFSFLVSLNFLCARPVLVFTMNGEFNDFYPYILVLLRSIVFVEVLTNPSVFKTQLLERCENIFLFLRKLTLANCEAFLATVL